MSTCLRCRRYCPGGRPCACPAPTVAAPTSTRAFASSLRAQNTQNAQNQPVPPGGRPATTGSNLWGEVTGQVRREQEVELGRAGGTRAAIVLALLSPVLVALVTGATSPDAIGSGLGAMLMLLLMPLAFLVLMMSLGRGGMFGFFGRVVGNSFRVGMGVAGARTRRPGRPGGSGRILIVGSGSGETRVAVARAVDVPLGSTVTVRGPRFGGYRHAWTVQVHGLDDRALATRGVTGAYVAVAFGVLFSVLGLLGALAGVAG